MASPHNPAQPIELTFILPTRNRRLFVERALWSCLAVDRPGIRVEVLVIDGNSTDGSWELLQSCFGSNSRVRLLRQEGPPGLIPGAFFALPHVRTEYCTFMYDDDVLSPHWWKLAALLKQSGSGFAMALGKVNNVDAVMNFTLPTGHHAVPPARLLGSFCQVGYNYPPHGLPYSPITCLTRTKTMREWAGEVPRWTRDRPFREYWMVQRCAGPDLMIFLLSCLIEKRPVAVVDGVLGQWSAHPDSLTLQFEGNDILVAYWLAKAWLCAALLERRNYFTAGICAAGVHREGSRLLQERRRAGKMDWDREFSDEIETVRRRALSGPARVGYYWFSLEERLPGWLRLDHTNHPPHPL